MTCIYIRTHYARSHPDQIHIESQLNWKNVFPSLPNSAFICPKVERRTVCRIHDLYQGSNPPVSHLPHQKLKFNKKKHKFHPTLVHTGGRSSVESLWISYHSQPCDYFCLRCSVSPLRSWLYLKEPRWCPEPVQIIPRCLQPQYLSSRTTKRSNRTMLWRSVHFYHRSALLQSFLLLLFYSRSWKIILSQGRR